MEDDKIPEFLKNLKKPPAEHLGKVPDGYFENFESRLMDRISQENNENKTKVRKINSFLVMGIAASFLMLILAGLWYFRNRNPLDYTQLAKLDIDKGLLELSDKETEKYLLANLDNIETEELAATLEESDLNKIFSENSTVNSTIDSLPPKPQNKVITEPKTQAQKTMKEEMEDDIADESDLEELLFELSDEEFKKLENALLKTPKKPE